LLMDTSLLYSLMTRLSSI